MLARALLSLSVVHASVAALDFKPCDPSSLAITHHPSRLPLGNFPCRKLPPTTGTAMAGPTPTMTGQTPPETPSRGSSPTPLHHSVSKLWINIRRCTSTSS